MVYVFTDKMPLASAVPIDPKRTYPLRDIVKLNLIPNMGRAYYNVLYKMCVKSMWKSATPISYNETTFRNMKAKVISRPWTKIVRWGIEWIELIKFLELNWYLLHKKD